MESIFPMSTGYDQSLHKQKKKQPSPPPSQSSVQLRKLEKKQHIYSTNIIQPLRELRISAAADT
ncbi:unnamed protein product [Brassica napus]|uniref:(rape) hypothetical protein n=1 Tax=Brassica napus TaxID=3708 RepID=A0A816X282_BRANA|nr:unnamed protein product [Brassica napus]